MHARALTLALAVTLAGCAGDRLTEIVVVVDTDLATPTELDAIRLVAVAPGGTRETMTPVGNPGDPTLPLSISLVHDGSGALGPLTVTAEGTLAGSVVVEQHRTTSWVEGRRRLLRLFLSRACRGVACATAEETCDDGLCEPATIPSEALPPWTGELPPRADGGLAADAPPDMDAGDDAGRLDGGDIDGGDCPPPSMMCGDVCIDVTIDPLNCGACGTACNDTHAMPACSGGSCVLSCDPGYDDCDGDPATGCEADLGSTATCGACAVTCDAATPFCARVGDTAMCVASCMDPTPTLCGGSCVDTSTDPTHCGGCDTPCDPLHGVGTCSGGACLLGACDPGFGDCDAMPDTGCERALDTLSDCGACGRGCVHDHATSTCAGGSCAIATCDAGWGDCDGSLATGCEQRTDTLVHCGACSTACARPNGLVSCASGSCMLVGCNPGFADCNGDPADGCEADLASAATCGACDNACPGSSPLCMMEMGSFVCRSACGDPRLSTCGTSCVDTMTDLGHCGGCGRACAPANGTGTCSAGVCSIVSCNPTFADCNRMASDGCEARLDAPSTCGSCTTVCSLPNTVESCTAGVCTIAACDPGFGNCDGAPDNGCETRLDTLTNCGSCGSTCSLPNAMVSCATRTCTFVSCAAGSTNCDGLTSNGCEDTTSDPLNCGACDRVCRGRPNASGVCVGGTCQVVCNVGYADCTTGSDGCECAPAPGATGICVGAGGRDCGYRCLPGRTDCNGAAADGCEVDTGGDVDRCGGCSTVCPARTNATRTCTGGTCGFSCNTGFGDCNGVATDGCEQPLAGSVLHCGMCGNACPIPARSTATCSMGTCGYTCNPPYRDCDASASNGCEIDSSSSVMHCGACFDVCPARPNASPTCTSGTCGYACNAGFRDCNGTAADGCEVRTETSVMHCGACGNACPTPMNATATCAASTCGFTCNPGYADCNGVPSDGCEVSLLTDVSHCGACPTVCPTRANAARTCSSGVCGFTCNPMFADCNSMATDGCEVNTSTSPMHCSACFSACTDYASSSPTCSAGSCGISCDATYANCDTVLTNGCEIQLTTDVDHCGTCPTVCPTRANASRTCSAGVCGYACNPSFADCNTLPADGCEIDTRSSLTHCGVCGMACGPGLTCRASVCATPTDWARRFGSAAADSANDVAYDTAGDVYITGSFAGTVDFGGMSETAAGLSDAFIAKYRGSDGVLQWVVRIGGSGNDVGTGITVDGAGNVTTVGSFEGMVDLGAGVETSAGASDVFIVSWTSARAFRWARRHGSTGADQARAIASDAAGNLYVTGGFHGTVDFGGGAGMTLSAFGAEDVFLASYTSAPAHRWSRRHGGTGNESGEDVATDGTNLYLTGWFQGTANFGGAALSAGGGPTPTDVVVASYQASTGNHQWSRDYGSGGNDRGLGVATDGSGNVYVTGSFEGLVDFGGGTLRADGTDAFAFSLTGAPAYRWQLEAGSTADDQGNAVWVDAAAGRVWLVGAFQGTTTFGGAALTSAGSTDAYVAVVATGTGAHVWSWRWGGTGADTAEAVTLAGGNAAVAGSFSSSVDFGRGALGSLGATDGFVLQMRL